MRISVKSDDGQKSKFVLRIFNEEAGNLAFDSVELILGNEDDVSVTEAHAKIAVDIKNDFIQDNDEKAVRFIIAQKIFLANIKKLGAGNAFIEEIAANKMLAKAGYGDALVYYYYILISRMSRKVGFDEFLFINIPWLSLHGVDDYDAKFFLGLKSKFSYKRDYNTITRDLFELLKGGVRGNDIIKAARLYGGMHAGNQIQME